MTCDLDTEALYAWVDGEAGARTERITAHQARCPGCRGRLQALHAVQNDLGAHMKSAMPRVDPLLALQDIRRHPMAEGGARWAGPGRDALAFAWGLHPGRCVAACLALGLVVSGLAWVASILA